MKTEELLSQMAAEADAKTEAAWKNYWQNLERLESGESFDAAARSELMDAAKTLGRREKMSRDAGKVRAFLQARAGLAKITPDFMAAEKKWIEAKYSELNARLKKFQETQLPLATEIQNRQLQFEQSRANKGLFEGEIARFEQFINGGPDSEAAKY